MSFKRNHQRLQPNLNINFKTQMKMKKKIIGITLAISAILSGSFYAQAQNDSKDTNAKTEYRQNAKAEKKNDKKGKKSDKEAKKRLGQRQTFNPFDGVQLTDDQQKRLQVLREGLGPVMPPQKMTKEQKKNLTEEQKKAMKQELKTKKVEQKKNYLNGVKEILSPDQYVLFLENVYLYSPEPSQSRDSKNAKMTKQSQGKLMKGNKSNRPMKKESVKTV